MLATLVKYDAKGERTAPHFRRLGYDQPPRPGDRVLIVDQHGPRVIVFDEVFRPIGPVWIVAVITRLAATALVLLAAVC